MQWVLLKYNDMNEESQFNNIFNTISDSFKRMITLGNDISKLDNIYDNWKILFSSIISNDEEERTTKYLMECVKYAVIVG